jgi:hypothetical protein
VILGSKDQIQKEEEHDKERVSNHYLSVSHIHLHVKARLKERKMIVEPLFVSLSLSLKAFLVQNKENTE